MHYLTYVLLTMPLTRISGSPLGSERPIVRRPPPRPPPAPGGGALRPRLRKRVKDLRNSTYARNQGLT